VIVHEVPFSEVAAEADAAVARRVEGDRPAAEQVIIESASFTVAVIPFDRFSAVASG
jgi:hypothetical protein